MAAGHRQQALAERVANDCQARLLQPRRAGGRLAPVRELAAELGVSVPTVRAAQRLLADRGLLQIRHGSGVYVAGAAAKNWIGIYTAFDVFQPRTSSFHTLVPYALRNYFSNHAIDAEIYVGRSAAGEYDQQPPNPRFLADVAAGRLSGVVFLTAPTSDGWEEWVAGLHIPAVGDHTTYQVNTGYEEMIRQAVRHLGRHGRRRIAMLSYAPGTGQNLLQKALAEAGLPLHREWVRHDFHPMLSGSGWEEFREIWDARREKPDGLLVTDDVLFDEARIAIQELGIRVPEQLRIVTHANKGAVRRYPFPVTEAQCDPERYAEALGAMLLKRLRGKPVEPPVRFVPFEMVETAAVAAPITHYIVPHEVEGAFAGQTAGAQNSHISGGRVEAPVVPVNG